MTHENSSDADARRDSESFTPASSGFSSPDNSFDARPALSTFSSGAHSPARHPAHRSMPSDEDPGHRTAEPGFGAGAARAEGSEQPPSETAGDASLARPRRRRGSRGGRRRRGRGRDAAPLSQGGERTDSSEGSDGGNDELPASEHGDDERSADEGLDRDAHGGATAETAAHAGPSDARSGRKRRGRRGRGRRREGPGAAPLAGPQAHGASSAHAHPSDGDRGVIAPARAPHEPRGNARSELHGTIAREHGGGGDAPRRDEHAAKKRRRRGGRGGRNRADKFAGRGGPRTIAEPMAPVEVEAIPGEEDDLPLLPDLPLEAEILGAPADDRIEAPGGRRSRRKKRGGKRRDEPVETGEFDEEDEAPRAEPVRNSLILVNAADPEEQRVAVVEDGQITDFQMTVRTEVSVVNDIYRGRVVNLEPAIGAAFVDFGQGRNGFLHTSDVLSAYGDKDWSLDKLLTTSIDPDEWDAEPGQPAAGADLVEDEAKSEGGEASTKRRPKRTHPGRFRARPRLPITDLLKKGEMVVVQVTKDAIGDKGPTLTTYISIPGRYLVLMPSMSRTGVSRKIEDEKERRRLKKILQQLEVPPGMGVIVRTAGVGHSRADLKRDLDYLKGAWDAFGKRLRAGHGPAPLYQESDVSIRTVRDLFTPGTEAVIVDDSEVHRQIVDFTKQLMPENEDRVKLHTGPRPLFHTYGVEPDFERVLARRIELPSGGSIVFDQAEALVAIDVNSGRTRSDSFDFEEIALKTNLEAAPEIARQIRLRDLGGIIVVDFIDMMRMANIRAVEKKFKDALADDRARSKVGRISQFGLLELTRQRLGPGMSKKVFHTCPRCRGTGRIRTIESRAAAILRRLGSAMTLKGFSTVEVRAHPEVIAYLKNSCNEYLRALEYRFERQIRLFDAPEQAEDSVLRYLRADGREVRPGGRRKR
jgi:ribonuclease E